MANKFGSSSLQALEGTDPRLVIVCYRVLTVMDIKITEGVRTAARQQELWKIGRDASGKIVEPKKVITHRDGINRLSNHQVPKGQKVGRAIDAAPWPVDYKDVKRFHVMGGLFRAFGEELGWPVIWGGDWDSDMEFRDQTFHDLPHIELHPDVPVWPH